MLRQLIILGSSIENRRVAGGLREMNLMMQLILLVGTAMLATLPYILPKQMLKTYTLLIMKGTVALRAEPL